ncbi:M50 family metallopeptidase [Candidatus Avelusimicrobium luingense]|uniref:M50 family metallopeptidase n=1 Tax=Candidatus Avelusimicrobium luingense TaxID=3416211 RepID=UPI003D11593B
MRFLKFVLAVILLPTVFFVLVQTGHILLTVLGHFQTAAAFVAGAAGYAILHYTVYDFSRPYVFMHEFTHALAAFLCGARVKDICVKRDSGYVKMDKTNVFIVLAPYFVPGYVLLTAFIYVVLGLFWNVTPYRSLFLGLLGFFMAFHFIQTFKTLFEADQPDLQLAGGKIFSVVMIVLANLVVLAIVLKGGFAEQVHLKSAAIAVVKDTVNLWRSLINYIYMWYARMA